MSKKGEDTYVKFPPINQKYNSTEIQNNNYAMSPRNSMSSSRRNSVYRRGSINQISDQTPSLSVSFANKTESDILKDCVPMTNLPRFSCDLSLEGRYAVFKGYEKILIKHLEASFPDYLNIINKTSNTVTNSINNVTLNRDVVSLKTLQYDKEFQNVHKTKEKIQKVNKKQKYNDGNDSNSNNNNSEEYEMQNKAKLLMSQYLQFAHVILDSLKPPSVVKSSKNLSKLPQKNFNTIQGWNWWNSSWQECFIQKYQPPKLH